MAFIRYLDRHNKNFNFFLRVYVWIRIEILKYKVLYHNVNIYSKNWAEKNIENQEDSIVV